MKNTVLALTTSTVATLFVLIVLFAVSPDMHDAVIGSYWVFYWTLSLWGWILMVIPLALTVLAFVLASREITTPSYVVAAIAGTFLAFLIDMLLFMAIIYVD